MDITASVFAFIIGIMLYYDAQPLWLVALVMGLALVLPFVSL